MPHKQKRKLKNDVDYELPPDIIARPLAASKSKKEGSKNVAPSRKRRRTDDDTPKEFLRLMSRMKPQDVRAKQVAKDTQLARGSKSKNGARKGQAAAETANAQTSTAIDAASRPAVELPTMKPGERLADFSARVDQALPLHGLISKGKTDLPGVKRQRTKLERKITRMQDEWRERDRRLKEKAAQAEEDEEIEAIMSGKDHGRRVFKILDQQDDDDNNTNNANSSKPKTGKKSKRQKRGGANGNNSNYDDDDDDPWAELAKKRKAEAEQRNMGLVGVHDVVQAPPRFNVRLKEKLKLRGSV